MVYSRISIMNAVTGCGKRDKFAWNLILASPQLSYKIRPNYIDLVVPEKSKSVWQLERSDFGEVFFQNPFISGKFSKRKLR